MIELNTPIVPYKGTGIFELDASYDETIACLKAADIEYTEKVWKDNDIDPPWTNICIGETVDGDIQLFFAKNRLFKIVLLNRFKGALPNGINLDTPIAEARRIDPTLQFEDWDEIFISSGGYWIEDSLITKKVVSITIFIPALLRDDFFEYKW